MSKIGRYSGLEWRFVVDDIDARLAALEAKPAPDVEDPDGCDSEGRTGPYAYDNGYSAGYASAWNKQQFDVERLKDELAALKAKPSPVASEKRLPRLADFKGCMTGDDVPWGYEPAPQRRACIVCGKWYEDDGTHVCTAKPAPVAEATSQLFAEYGDAHEVFGYQPATPAQVKAEYERLFPEVKVAVEFLHAALVYSDGHDACVTMSHWAGYFTQLADDMNKEEGHVTYPGSTLRRMAAVLEQAAKEAADEH